MLFLFKKDIFMYGWSLLLLLLVVPLLTVLPVELGYFSITAALTIHLFYYDNKARANRYVVSLPISKSKIIRSRYLFLLLMAISILLLQLVVHVLFSYIEFIQVHVFQWQDIIAICSFFLILSAVFVPLYYLIQSFTVAMVVQSTILFFGFISFLGSLFGDEQSLTIDNKTVLLTAWIDKYFPTTGYILIPIIAGVLYFLSMKISEQFFKSKVV